MRVEHALRIAGGAGGVAEAGGGVLVEAAPGHVGRGLLDQAFVGERARQLVAEVRFVREDDEVLHAGDLVADARQDRQEGQVGEDDLIVGMVDDVDQLLCEQARVQGVAHRADAHDAVPGLDVAAGVPGQGGDTVAGNHAQRLERVRHALGAFMDRGVGGADDRPLDRTADDLAAAVPGLGVVEDLVDRQRPVLHQTLHTLIFLPTTPPSLGLAQS